MLEVSGPSSHTHTLTHMCIHVPSTGSHSHYFLLFLLGAKCRKCVDTYYKCWFSKFNILCFLAGRLAHWLWRVSKHFVPISESLKHSSLVTPDFCLSLDPKFRYSGGPPDFLQNSQIEHWNYVWLSHAPFLSFTMNLHTVFTHTKLVQLIFRLRF